LKRTRLTRPPARADAPTRDRATGTQCSWRVPVGVAHCPIGCCRMPMRTMMVGRWLDARMPHSRSPSRCRAAARLRCAGQGLRSPGPARPVCSDEADNEAAHAARRTRGMHERSVEKAVTRSGRSTAEVRSQELRGRSYYGCPDLRSDLRCKLSLACNLSSVVICAQCRARHPRNKVPTSRMDPHES